MAVGQALRYYHQQFNPGGAYQRGSSQGGDVFSMYDPEGMGRYMEAVEKRQGRFDTAKMAEAQEIARIGETETYDIMDLTNRIKSFESGVNTLVKDKYNGDYSAAANEIAKMIGTERTNPFYHFNKEKVEVGKSYLNAKMQMGADFMASENPFEVSFKDWQSGRSLQFTPVNRQTIVRDAAAEFGSIADTMINDPDLRDTPDGRFVIATIQSGLKDPAQLKEFMATQVGQDMINNIMKKNPTLAKLPQEQVLGAITEGAYSAIGKTNQNVMQNPDYLDAYQRAQIIGKQGGTPNLIVDAGIFNTPQLSKEMKEENNNLTTAYKESILQDILKNPKYESLRGTITSLKDIGDTTIKGVLGRAGRAYSGGMTLSETEKKQLNPALSDLSAELDQRADAWFSGNAKGLKGEPLGIRSYKLSQFPQAWTPENVTMLGKINDTFQTALKPYVTGTKTSPNVSYIGRQSKRNSANMDATKDVNVTNIGFDPYSPNLIFGVTGVNKEGTPLESKVAINGGAGGIMDPNIRQILGAYVGLGQNDPQFMETVYAWAKKYYPNDPLWGNTQ